MNLFDERSTVQATNGMQVPIIDVIAFSIQFLAGSALEQLNKSTNKRKKTETFTMADIQWVITVPALWNDAAKQIMRGAAMLAGLPPSMILALEPEAAALCCRECRKDLEFPPGTKYMVVDCGGGTVDIAVHEIDEDRLTQSKCGAKGNNCGSTSIDANFRRLLLEIFEHESIENFIEGIMGEFERQKIAYSPDSTHGSTVVITIPNGIAHNSPFVNFDKFPDDPILFDENKLYLSPTAMKSFFEKPIQSIVNCVQSLLDGLADTVDYIFLVGGFSRSVILQKAMEIFESDVTEVILPDNPGMAVAQGAVYFGLNPRVVASRYSNFTYGIKGAVDFIDGFHPEEKKIKIDDRWYCEVFSTFIEKDKKIKLDHEVVHFVGKTHRLGKSLHISLYCSEKTNVEYISAETKKLVNIELEVPVSETREERNVKVTMIFGGTEIHFKAEHVVTKKVVSISVEFAFTSKSEIFGLPLSSK